MGRRLSMATRAELLEVVRERYGGARPAERRLILDEFVAVSGYHRKHAIRLLRQPGGGPAPDRRGRSPVYDAAVRAALVVVWEASDRICGKRLKAALPVLVPAMERHGHLSLDEVVRSRLLAVSASTIDRLLRDVRARARAGRRPSGATSAVRRGVRVRTFSAWGEPPPGFTEIDLVAHSGPSMAGAFAWTLVLTDVATGWTECVPLPCRDRALVVEALTRLRGVLPFPLGGAYVANDSVLMNEHVVGWCRANGIEVTRSRAYRKNDQAWVEQKNGAVVRRLVGHDRLEGGAATGELARCARARGGLWTSSSPRSSWRPSGATAPGSAAGITPRRRPTPACWRRARSRPGAGGGSGPSSRPSPRSRCWRRSGARRSGPRLWRPMAGVPIRRPRSPAASWPTSCRGSAPPGRRAGAGPRTGRSRRGDATGARAPTRSRRSRRACAPGWRPSRTCRPPTCWRGSGRSAPAGTPASSFARCNVASATGGGGSPTASSSAPRRRQRRARMPVRLTRRAGPPRRRLSRWI